LGSKWEKDKLKLSMPKQPKEIRENFLKQGWCFLCNQLVARGTGFVFWLLARKQKIGETNIKKKEPLLLVCNHISHFDPPVIASFFSRKIDFMAMRDLFKGAWNFFFWSLDAFPVHREGVDTAAVREALRRLKIGRVVCVFPEGGLRTGKESILGGAKAEMGAATLAHMAKVKVKVCLIIGTDQFYCVKNLLRRPPIFFIYGPELILDLSLSPKEARKRLNTEIVETMHTLYRKFKEEFQPQEEILPCTAQERWSRGR
jgi:1-acyl-sn-glycerol-3-phosphate acyltransferase